jgi:glucosamine--fructose-6-phosphate aminotransferase (isomerizing)
MAGSLPGELSREEILSQPQVWEQMLKEIPGRLEELRPGLSDARFFLFTGCGSAYHVALSATAAFRARGFRAEAATAGEVWLFPEQFSSQAHGQTWACVGFSRSGETTETLEALRETDKRGAFSVGVTCEPQSPMAQARHVLLLEEAREKSIITTRSVTAMILASHLAADMLSGYGADLGEVAGLPEACEQALKSAEPVCQRLARMEHLRKFVFLGSGPLWGAACEARLKMQETSLIHSESFPVLDFRHGPMAQLDEFSLVVGLLSQPAGSGAGWARDLEALRHYRALGGTVLAICERAEDDLRQICQEIIELRSGLPDWRRQPLYLPPAHLLAWHKAVCLGLDPDRPRHLARSVKMEQG